jgi:hypothetical protein
MGSLLNCCENFYHAAATAGASSARSAALSRASHRTQVPVVAAVSRNQPFTGRSPQIAGESIHHSPGDLPSNFAAASKVDCEK